MGALQSLILQMKTLRLGEVKLLREVVTQFDK